MENKYIYREHLRKPGKFFLTIILTLMIPFLVIGAEITLAINYIDRVQVGLMFLILGIFLAVFLIIELFLIYLIVYRRFKKIYLVLTDEGIIYNNAKREVRIPYEDIKALKFRSIRYAGGWIKIIHNNGKVRLTVVLEDIGDMVKNLKNKIDEKNISNVYRDKGMYNFYKTAKYSDQSWERIYEYFKKFIIAACLNIGIAAIFDFFIGEMLVKAFVIIGAVFGSLLVFIIAEIILGRKLAKGASKENFSVPDRDKEFELKIYKWTFGIYLIIFLIIMIMLLV